MPPSPVAEQRALAPRTRPAQGGAFLPATEEGGRAMRRRRTGRRTAAVLAIAAGVFTLLAVVTVAIQDFPRGLLILMCGSLAAVGSWEGVLRRGWARAGAMALALAALGGGILLLADEGFLRTLLMLTLGALVWHVGARIAFGTHVDLPPAPRPEHPVLFIN